MNLTDDYLQHEMDCETKLRTGCLFITIGIVVLAVAFFLIWWLK